MCLHKVTQSVPGPGDLEREGFAYKVYEKVKGRWVFPCRPPQRESALDRNIPPGTWITTFGYTVGFHCCVTFEGALRLVEGWGKDNHRVFRVKWRGLLSRGTEGDAPVIVVKEILSKRRLHY